MLLRGNPGLPSARWRWRRQRFVLQGAPVPKRTDVTRPTARIASWISRGNSSPLKSRASWIPCERIARRHGIPARKIPYLYRPQLPLVSYPFCRAGGSRSCRIPRSYFSSLLSGQQRASSPLEKLLSPSSLHFAATGCREARWKPHASRRVGNPQRGGSAFPLS